MDEHSFFEAPAQPEDVALACRWILGREPRTPAEAARLAGHATRGELRRALLAGKAGLHQQLMARFGPEKWVLAEVLDGLRMWLNLCDRHVSLGCLAGTWEPAETAFMRARLKPGQTVVDIGANIGWFSLVAGACVGPNGRVLSFEPQPRIFRYLARTIAENGFFDRITPYPLALADHWQTVEMAWSPQGANMGRAWIGPAAAADGALGQVRAGRLDDIIGASRVDFLKIDAEGAEALALAGAESLLQRCRPVVMIEIVPRLLERVSGVGPEAIFARLAGLGYRGFTIGESSLGDSVSQWPADRTEMNLAFMPG